MATAPTLVVFILITISTVKATTSDTTTESPTVTSAETNTTTNATKPPCPAFKEVYSERGDDAVNICWTMMDNWNESDATYEIHFRLQNMSTVSVQHNESGNCQVVNYRIIALDVGQTIEYNVTVNWRDCNATWHSPPPRPSNTAHVANIALTLGVISALLVMAVVVYSRRKKRSREL